MPSSNIFPQVKKLRNGVLIPFNVKEKSITDEEGSISTQYDYEELLLHQKVFPTLTQLKECVIHELNRQNDEFIYSHYTGGTQATIQGYAQKAARRGRTDIQDECEAILDWIESVLAYYDVKKGALAEATDEQSLISITWDFKTNTSISPSGLKGWREIRDMFNS